MLLPPLLGLRSFSNPKRMDTFSDMIGRQDTVGHRKIKSSLTRIKGEQGRGACEPCVDRTGPALKTSGARTHAASDAHRASPARGVISCGRHKPSGWAKVESVMRCHVIQLAHGVSECPIAGPQTGSSRMTEDSYTPERNSGLRPRTPNNSPDPRNQYRSRGLLSAPVVALHEALSRTIHLGDSP